MITGQGLLIILAGFIESNSGMPNVEITVNAKPDYNESFIIHPDSVKIILDDAELKIATYPENSTINIKNQPKAQIDSLMQFAKTWNIENGFIPTEQSTEETDDEKSWWQHNIADPLGNWIKNTFGEDVEKATSDKVGNIGFVYFYLTQQPKADEPVVINFGRSSGDKSISLIMGERITINDKNWNIPAIAAIQLDPKLRTSSSALFIAQSGNIPLAWMITFLFMAALFILFFISFIEIFP